MSPGENGSNMLWEPSAEAIERSRMTAYQRWLSEQRGVETGDYEALWRWSVENLDEFWSSIWDYFEVEADGDHSTPLASREMPGARWFEGTKLNYAEHVFRGVDDDEVAVLHASELRELGEVRWGELREQVAAVAEGLRAEGVTTGDRVVAYLPNGVEALVAFLATASLGAIWSSCSPDFGPSSVVDRFAQIEPKVMFAVDGYRYGGKDFDRMATVADVAGEIPSLERIVVVPYLSESPDLSPLERADHDGSATPMTWAQLAELGEGATLRFERVPFDHPLWVLYSSGTTGLPKAIVQGHGGILLEQLKKLNLHLDAQGGDRVFWFTTTGWMMWNFLVGVLLTPASIVLYDGNPGHPDMGVLWDLASRAGVTCFGTSASYISACMKDGVEPQGDGRDLSRLRAVGSTGSPLSPEGFEWVYEHVGRDTWLFSTSGGTDVCTAFVGGVPILPVYRGELQGRALGCAVESFDEEGKSVIGEVGELVLTEPMPSMPVFFWGDEDGSRYRESYFDMFPGRLAPRRLDRDHRARHGDHLRPLGLDDQPLGGPHGDQRDLPRGPGRPRDPRRPGGGHPARGHRGLDAALRRPARGGGADRRASRRRSRSRIREACSPRHVPNEMYAIAEVPRTLSGKVLEVPVKRILMGEDPDKAASRDSLANPGGTRLLRGARCALSARPA